MEQDGVNRRLSSDGSLITRNITVNGRRTSVLLEPETWEALAEIARREGLAQHQLCTRIEAHKAPSASLTSAIRVYCMTYFRAGGRPRAGAPPPN